MASSIHKLPVDKIHHDPAEFLRALADDAEANPESFSMIVVLNARPGWTYDWHLFGDQSPTQTIGSLEAVKIGIYKSAFE
jgi:hypothetical protein